MKFPNKTVFPMFCLQLQQAADQCLKCLLLSFLSSRSSPLILKISLNLSKRKTLQYIIFQFQSFSLWVDSIAKMMMVSSLLNSSIQSLKKAVLYLSSLNRDTNTHWMVISCAEEEGVTAHIHLVTPGQMGPGPELTISGRKESFTCRGQHHPVYIS